MEASGQSVGQLYYTLDLDDAKFEEKLAATKAESASTGTSINKTFDSIGQAAVRGSAVFATGLGLTGIAVAGVGIASLVAAGQIETIHQAFVTLLGSTKAADTAIAMIKKDAATTPFTFQGLVQANEAMTAVIGNSQVAERLILNVGKALTIMGNVGPEAMALVTRNLQQIAAFGRLQSRDLLQFSAEQIPIYDILSTHLHKTTAEIQDMTTNGEISFTMLMDSFNAFGEGSGKAANAYSNAAGTLQQVWSNFQDILFQFGSDLAKNTGLLGFAEKAFISLTAWMQANKDNIITFINQTFGWMKNNFPIITGFIIGGLVPALIALSLWIGPALLLATAFSTIGAGIGYLFQNWSRFGPVIQMAIAGLTGAVLGLALAYMISLIPSLITTTVVAWALLAPFLLMAAPFVAIGLAAGVAAFLIISNWTAIVSFLTTAWQTIMSGVNWLKDNWIEALGFVIGFVLTFPIKLPLLMFQAVTGMAGAVQSINWGAVFSGIWNAAVGAFNAVKGAAFDAWNYLTNLNWGGILIGIGRGLGNAIIDLVNGAIAGAFAGVPILKDHVPHIPHFAEGVADFTGGLAVVGERGPELINLPRGSDVVPNNKLGALGGTTINIHMDGVMTRSRSDLKEIAKDMISLVNEELRAKGKPQLSLP